jgi:hypothetical protein
LDLIGDLESFKENSSQDVGDIENDIAGLNNSMDQIEDAQEALDGKIQTTQMVSGAVLATAAGNLGLTAAGVRGAGLFGSAIATEVGTEVGIEATEAGVKRKRRKRRGKKGLEPKKEIPESGGEDEADLDIDDLDTSDDEQDMDLGEPEIEDEFFEGE